MEAASHKRRLIQRSGLDASRDEKCKALEQSYTNESLQRFLFRNEEHAQKHGLLHFPRPLAARSSISSLFQ
jgi:hypothetical protein